MKLVGEAETVHKKPFNTKLKNLDLNQKTKKFFERREEFQLDSTLQTFLHSAAIMAFTKLRSHLAKTFPWPAFPLLSANNQNLWHDLQASLS